MNKLRIAHILGPAVAAGALMLASAAAAQSSASQTINGSMTLFQPIVVTKTSDLSFGTLIRPESGNGNATIDASSGNLVATGGIGVVGSSSHGRAVFVVTGEGGLNFTVQTPASFNMTRNGGQDPIQVTLTSTTGGGTLSGVNGSQGTATIGIGGQMLISNGTPSGAYTGAFTVTVAYN